MLSALEREKAGAGEKAGVSMSAKATFNVDVLSRVTGDRGDMEMWGQQSGHSLHGPGSSRRGASGRSRETEGMDWPGAQITVVFEATIKAQLLLQE